MLQIQQAEEKKNVDGKEKEIGCHVLQLKHCKIVHVCTLEKP